MYNKKQKIHFIGIGGIGMSGIARVLLKLGYAVSGSDLAAGDSTSQLTALGAEINVGHRAEWLGTADVVVVSSAIGADNPELRAARERGIRVIPRAEMLAELMRLQKFGIAIAGSHGKTTTTSMVAWLLSQAGLDPTVIIGGKVDSLGGNAKLGEGDFVVAEADESDGSFLRLSPVIEVITNIDFEHVDYYQDLETVKKTFLQFIDKIPFYGVVILCLDDPVTVSLLPEVEKRCITYGLEPQADVQARDIRLEETGSSFEILFKENLLGRVRIPLSGLHNVTNSLAAIAVGMELDIAFEVIAAALATFSGVERRLQVKGTGRGVIVVDDYGHHPTEIRATLQAMRQAHPRGRLIVCFQPHRYSRTAGLFDAFLTAFHQADILFVTDIYAASETPLPGISGQRLAQGIRQHGHRHCHHVPEVAAVAAAVLPLLQAGDIVLTLGAGNIFRAGEEIVKMLNKGTQSC